MMTLSLEQMKANRKLWVDALRSGKYRQGKGQLKFGPLFCCLGVACDIFHPDGWERGHPVGWDAKSGGLIPQGVREQLGLNPGTVSRNSGEWALANLNDNGKTFGLIAGYIEREPKGLFIESVQP